MRIGVSFPTVEIGADLAVVRDFVHTAEELGYTHLRVLDHVLGADPQFHPEVPVFYYSRRRPLEDHQPGRRPRRTFAKNAREATRKRRDKKDPRHERTISCRRCPSGSAK